MRFPFGLAGIVGAGFRPEYRFAEYEYRFAEYEYRFAEYEYRFAEYEYRFAEYQYEGRPANQDLFPGWGLRS
ncbi:hypothetical protein [Candidatus Laterigemmans baculatus]|uniref:hypothetical protein n=1 Tax=Candidatus Laterigemmans baculatus TaxID=2770505 RepID=UPI0013DC958C|nr:hypothetical protein [Candidatus Laterigemmans baculatus]